MGAMSSGIEVTTRPLTVAVAQPSTVFTTVTTNENRLS
jgi:hypothetical protein